MSFRSAFDEFKVDAGRKTTLSKMPNDFIGQAARVRTRRETTIAQKPDAVDLAGLRQRLGREEQQHGSNHQKEPVLFHSITPLAPAYIEAGMARLKPPPRRTCQDELRCMCPRNAHLT